ncbi:MAG: hypothetical protein ACPGID_12355 [Rubricella sp.]
MTDASVQDSRLPLGAGTIIGATFPIFFRRFPLILLLGFVVSITGQILTALIFGLDVVFGEAGVTGPADFARAAVITLVMNAIIISMMVQIAHDAAMGRPARPLGYLRDPIANILPIIVLSLVVGFMGAIGYFILFSMPFESQVEIAVGLLACTVLSGYIYSVYICTVPAIVVEGAGFRALGHSQRLTKGYRWPIFGTMLLMIILSFVIVFAIVIAIGLFLSLMLVDPLVRNTAALVLNAFGQAMLYGFISIPIALIYARLREIKDGVGMEDIAEVFE